MALGDDLRAFLAGLEQVPDKLEAIGESFDRVVEASLAAGLSAGAEAIQGELRRERPRALQGAAHAERANAERANAGSRWKPAPGCIHDGKCKSPNPWNCHPDLPRKHPGGKIGPKGETELYCCGCAPCHPNPTTKAAVQSSSLRATVGVDERLSRVRVTAEAASPSPRSTASTSCEKHGVCAWNGHLICGNCRRIYQALSPKAERYAPDVCACSANLRPREREPFAGRPFCHLCYLAHRSFGRMA